MRKGKIAAQVAHASMKFLVDDAEDLKRQHDKRGYISIGLTDIQQAWLFDPESAHAKVVVSCDSENELYELMNAAKSSGIEVHKIIDAGRTEFNGVPTLTCAAFGPEESSKLNKITGHLKLL